MKRLLSSLISLFSPGKMKTKSGKPLGNSKELFNTFHEDNHLQPLFDKSKFDTLHKPLYDNLKKFDEYDDTYFATNEKMMSQIENYARQHTEEFIKFI